jgi:integral membrane sensor domain MASE1
MVNKLRNALEITIAACLMPLLVGVGICMVCVAKIGDWLVPFAKRFKLL